MACKLEPATRRCDTCAAPRFELVPPSWGDGHFHFCFACFYTHHDRSPAMKAHKAVLTRALTAPPLTCWCVLQRARAPRGRRWGEAVVHVRRTQPRAAWVGRGGSRSEQLVGAQVAGGSKASAPRGQAARAGRR